MRQLRRPVQWATPGQRLAFDPLRTFIRSLAAAVDEAGFWPVINRLSMIEALPVIHFFEASAQSLQFIFDKKRYDFVR